MIKVETRAITKLFKETQLKIAYKVNNTINKRLAPKPGNSCPNKSKIKAEYTALHVPDCHKKYVGQTDRSFKKGMKSISTILSITYASPVLQPIY